MQKKWYESWLTWGCIALCVCSFLAGCGMEEQTAREREGLCVEILENCQVYELQYVQEGGSGGTVNADGSALKKGDCFSWHVGGGVQRITVTALDRLGRAMFTVTTTHDFGRSPCELQLTGAGFRTAEYLGG